MNITAPASVPGLASLALLLAVPPETAAAIPRFAPPQCPLAGAGTFHSFMSTLADLLPVEGKPEGKPEQDRKQEESKVVITGVAIPAPAPETLPFKFAMLLQPAVKGEVSERGPAPSRLELLRAAVQAANVMPAKAAAGPRSIPVAPQAADTVTPFAFIDPVPKTPEPQAAPRGVFEPVLTIVEPRAATVPAPELAPELPNLAFAEKFTAAPATQDAAVVPASHPLSPTPALTNALPTPAMAPMRPATGDRPTESAGNPADGVPPSPAGNAGEPEHASEQRHGNGERQRSSGESLPQPKASPEPSGREEVRIEKPGFEPPAPVSVSTKATAESSQPAPAVKAADIPHMEPEPTRLQPAPTGHTPDAHAISVRVTDAGDARVELKVTEHAGELRVSVRTADPELAGTLRENLGDLVHKLEQSGFRADTWHPSPSGSPEGIQQTRSAEGESLGGDHSGRQQQHSGDDREQKQKDPERAAWIEELETSVVPDSERMTPPWLPA